jgi:transcriptional regulator with XRE-family HTH domain
MKKRVSFRKDRQEGRYSHFINDSAIRAEMARNNYNYSDMAKMMGVTHNTFQAFINGKIEPSAGRISQVCKIFNLPASALFMLDCI